MKKVTHHRFGDGDGWCVVNVLGGVVGTHPVVEDVAPPQHTFIALPRFLTAHVPSYPVSVTRGHAAHTTSIKDRHELSLVAVHT